MLTTLCSYGTVPPERLAEILQRQLRGVGSNAFGTGEPDAGTIQNVLAHLAKTVTQTA